MLSTSFKSKFLAILFKDLAAIAKLPLFLTEANKAVGEENVVKFLVISIPFF